MSKAQAIILAGGQGSRMRPFTTVLPKPLLPVKEFPICELIIKQLKSFDIKNIIISTGHLSGLIEAYFGKGKKFGVNIRYIKEKKPLGTAGAIKLAQIQPTDETRTEIAPALVKLLSDKNETVRTASVEALAVWHEPGSIAAMARVLDDPSPQVSSAAEAALKKIGNRQAMEAIVDRKISGSLDKAIAALTAS